MKENKWSKIVNIVFIIITLFIIYKVFGIYKTYYYGDFIKAEGILGLTKFTRDKQTVYNYDYSYKLESKDFNDAIFYKTINVKPDTPYKLTCMVKTENVELENNKSNSGAQISIVDTTESSRSITGTNDWKELEFIFDSKNREEIKIGFRLGGNVSNAKGTVWFSDFKLEEGVKDKTSNWSVACFIIQNVDLNIKGQDLKISMSVSDIEKMKENMERFKTSMKQLSNNKMSVEYDIYEINEPIKTITYSDEFGYYLDPLDVKDVIEDYINKEEYDYIFIAARLGDVDENIEIPVYDWIGLRRYGFIWNWIFKYKITK